MTVFTKRVTCSGPVNIAVIKYWGKRNEELILPTNSSLSATLNQDDLKTTTTVMASSKFTEDRIWINNTEESILNPRLQNVLKEFRKRGALALENNKDEIKNYDEKVTLLQCKIHISSINNFPTAAGLASSASGYATLVYTLAQLFDMPMGDLSQIARVGSGSACRSLFGGWAKWNMGSKEDGSDSRAVQTHSEKHWPEMKILVLVVSDKKKGTSSTSGMKTTIETSSLFQHRINNVVEERIKNIEKAITERDFETFGKITMMDSNQFHSVCLDTYPPIFYMNDISRAVVQLVTKYNDVCNDVKVAYTFDAGPNAVVYGLKDCMEEFLALVNHFFPSSNPEQFFRGQVKYNDIKKSERIEKLIEQIALPKYEDALNYALLTNPGAGPMKMAGNDTDNVHLLSNLTGLPC